MIITLAHSKGGVGKSLLAWHLAVALKVSLIDLDFQKTLVYCNSLRKANGRNPLNIIQPNTPEEFIEKIQELDEDEDIIIDVGGFDSNLNRAAICISDFIITPAVDRATEIAGLYKFHAIIKELSDKLSSDITANVLLNDISPNAKDFTIMEDLIKELNHFKLMRTTIAHRAPFYKKMEEGMGVTEIRNMESDKKNKSRKEIKELIKEINESRG